MIGKEALGNVAGRLAGDFLVYAPVKEGDGLLFKELGPTDAPVLGWRNSTNAPKNLFFPQTELLMRYMGAERGVTLAEGGRVEARRVLFGIRPCDCRSFLLLDLLFDQEKYRDRYYIDKREATTIIAVACVEPPYSTCFCTSVAGNPTSGAGADILLTETSDGYVAEFITDKGLSLKGYFGEEMAGASWEEERAVIATRAAEAIKSSVPGKEIKPILDNNFEHPFWETIHRRCLACGACTYLCPTCHCFDISDEVKADQGVRLRLWDSCMYPLFTREASGHNPRPTQKERWRQRVMHKFKYYVDNFNAISCVGCGRCVMSCPVNIDIRKIVQDISRL
ncbi:MAG: 4Fe-4S dicluster domain-containing protein [Smithellaceae bacterium]|nr:4Fe-4S dicluster domain-containing protein [Smithellaceae bacterium]